MSHVFLFNLRWNSQQPCLHTVCSTRAPLPTCWFCGQVHDCPGGPRFRREDWKELHSPIQSLPYCQGTGTHHIPAETSSTTPLSLPSALRPWDQTPYLGDCLSPSQPGLPVHLSSTLSPGPWHMQLLSCPKSSRTSQPLLLLSVMPFLFLSAFFFLTLAVKPCSGITSFQLSHVHSHQLRRGAFSFLFGAPHPAKHLAHSRHSAAGGEWKLTSQTIDLWERTVLCSNLIVPKSLF